MPRLARAAEAAGKLWRFLAGETDAARDALVRAFEDNFDGVALIGEDGTILAASRVASTMLLGQGGGSIVGRVAGEVLPGPILTAVQHVFAEGRRAVPTPLHLAVIGDPSTGGHIVNFGVNLSEIGQRGGVTRRVAQLTFWDETERRHRERELAYVGTHDQLTGALTRRELIRTIEAMTESDRRRAAGFSVLELELNRFRAVNDTLGREHGDMLLKQVVGRLKAAGLETVARLGGDNFAVVHPGRSSPQQMADFCAALIERIVLPYTLGQHRAIVGAAIGLTHSDVSGFDAEVLLSHASLALAAAKAAPGSKYVCFTPEMDQRLKDRQAMDLALRLARDRGELSIVYQPQCVLGTGELSGVEAQVRWTSAELGVVPPARFLAAAEENGEIVEIGRWVLRAACREVARWPFRTRLTVSISPVLFEFTDVVAEVREALELSGLAPKRLDIAIPEAVFTAGADQVFEGVGELRRLGVGVVVDRFGAGGASLSGLRRMPVDKVRIDESIVAGLPAEAESAIVIQSVAMLSQALGRTVIAQGVETADHAWMLRMMGCSIGQGYHFGRPRAGPEMARWHEDASVRRSLAG